MSNYFDLQNSPVLTTPSALVAPKITSIGYPGDDTAADPAGGQTITLTGAGFEAGASVIINSNAVGVVSVVNSTTITFTTPALSAGSYPLYVVNTDGGTAIAVPGIQYSGVPAWTTAAGSLGSYTETTAISNTVVATGDAPITYSLFSGSLPTGATLNSANGLISGASPLAASPTTYTFTIRATDAQQQDTNRQFSLTINPDVVTWSTPANNTTYTSVVNSAISNVSLNATAASGQTVSYTANALPAGLSITGSNISGTPTVVANSSTLLTATAATTNATATRTINWVITVASDTFFPYVTTLLSAATPTSTFVTDASTNNFAVTVNGDTRPSNFGPYTPGYYSNFFDGTGDYLSVPTNQSALAMGSSDFTIEAWVYKITSGLAFVFCGQTDAQTAGGSTYGLYVTDTAATSDVYIGGTGYGVTSPNPTLNTWAHVAFVRTGGTLSTYLNGTRVGTRSDLGSGSLNAGATTYPPSIGGTGFGSNLTGYISNLRIIKGSGGYDATQTTITVPTAPLTVTANTSLLTCQSNRLIDNSTNNFTITRNGDVRVDSFDPFLPDTNFAGRGSGYFDGTGDWINTPATSALEFGSGDFTLEFWINPADTTRRAIYHGSSGTDWSLGIDFQSQRVCIWASSNGSSWNLINADGGGNGIGTITVPVNTWAHVALVRSGTTWQTYINGIRDLNLTGISGAIVDRSASAKSIGKWFFTNGVGTPTMWNGYISDFRALKGTALYTTNFTPPTAPLTAISNTSLLTLQNNQPTNNSMFLDSSTNNLNVTRVGNSTQGSVNPYTGGSMSVYFPNSGVMNAQSTAGAHLTVTNTTAFDLGTGDFTLEGWIYPLSLPSSDNWPSNWWQTSSLFGRGTTNLGDGYNLVLGATRLIFQNSDSNIANGVHNITVNNWYHVAACRSSGTLRLFVNGSQVASASFTGSVGGGSIFYVGTETGQGAYFNGYMSNIRLVRGTALYTTTFTPSTSPLLPITGTQLLIANEGNWIDDSNNQYTVTPVNSPTTQKFNPFAPRLIMTSASYSYNFTGGNLQVANNSALVLSGGTFTIECWIYNNGDYSSYRTIITKRTGASAAWQLYLRISTGVLSFYTSAGEINSSSTPPAYQWSHVAAVYDGTNINLYMNGSRVHQAAVANNDVATAVTIGAVPGISENYSGYVSNLRITKGAQLYTGTTYTVPSVPLTTTVPSGTVSLLTCQSATIVDNSANNFALTITNTVSPSRSNPGGYTYSTSTAYTPATYGASTYLDGNGDYLTVADNAAFEISNGAFTIECWIWPNSMKGYQGIVGKTGAADLNGWNLYFETNNNLNFVAGNGSWTVTMNAGTVSTGGWTHVAVTRDTSNVWRMFTNGVLRTSTTNSATINETAGSLQIGRWPFFPSYASTMDFGGYISDVRIIKGSTLYTNNFIPPTAPLTSISNTTFLANMTGAGIYDSSMTADYETLGNASISTAVKKYGNTSMYFDGSGDYLQLPSGNQSYNLSSGDWTIECWVYFNTFTTTTTPHLWTIGTNTDNRYSLYRESSGGKLSFVTANSGSYTFANGTTTVATGTWYHVAVVRNNGVSRLYVNGVQEASSTTAINSGTSVFVGFIGFGSAASDYLNGYIDDLRITNGIARYTGTFTPPTSPFIRF